MSFQPWQRKEEVEPIDRRIPDSWNSRNSYVQNNMRNNTGWSLFSQVLADRGFQLLKPVPGLITRNPITSCPLTDMTGLGIHEKDR